jgi:hypothetical protein
VVARVADTVTVGIHLARHVVVHRARRWRHGDARLRLRNAVDTLVDAVDARAHPVDAPIHRVDAAFEVVGAGGSAVTGLATGLAVGVLGQLDIGDEGDAQQQQHREHLLTHCRWWVGGFRVRLGLESRVTRAFMKFTARNE